jgi:pyrroloquinoline quinone biosynthesis protein D
MSEALTILPESKPRLPRGVRLTENPQQGWVLVAPERVFKADGIAAVILQRCDGVATVGEMADHFAAAYNAPRERILTDIVKLLQSLADKRLLETANE